QRDIVRLVTPGTVLEGEILDEKSNNYIACIAEAKGGYGSSAHLSYGIAYCDISTGEFRAASFEGDDAEEKMLSELTRLAPAEIVLPSGLPANKLDNIKAISNAVLTEIEPEYFLNTEAERRLKAHFNVVSIEPFGLSGRPAAVSASGALLAYIEKNQVNSTFFLEYPRTYTGTTFMVLDSTAQRNLELVKNLRDQSVKGTLLSVLDRTVTSPGSRLLKKWILQPLTSCKDIMKRQAAVAIIREFHIERGDIRDILKKIQDLERLNAKIAYKSANARDLLSLKSSLEAVAELRRVVEKFAEAAARGAGKKGSNNENHSAEKLPEKLVSILKDLDPPQDIVHLIASSIREDAPLVIKEGGMIKPEYSRELKEVLDSTAHAREWIAGLEKRERDRTGIKTLKVQYNKVFGYFIEVTKSYLKDVPPDYIRKQTLVNCERYVTEELQRYETLVLSAEEKINAIEYDVFCSIRDTVAARADRIAKIALAVAELDVYQALAETAVINNYTAPVVNDTDSIRILGGRHPVIEVSLPPGTFVANDTVLDTKENQILIITGPNMAGKSTYMRQVALIIIMAQIGSFVPADSAEIGIVDRIFTRVGAYDDVSRGQSTFMVEMIETASILNHATPKSLILLDEVGRGTSTFDGLSIAWAVVEHIHNNPRIRAKTIFATHFHQLVELEKVLQRVKNYHMPVKEKGSTLIFLRKVLPGTIDKSYGIQVAMLAGLPHEVTARAKEILDVIENNRVLTVVSLEHDRSQQPLVEQPAQKPSRASAEDAYGIKEERRDEEEEKPAMTGDGKSEDKTEPETSSSSSLQETSPQATSRHGPFTKKSHRTRLNVSEPAQLPSSRFIQATFDLSGNRRIVAVDKAVDKGSEKDSSSSEEKRNLVIAEKLERIDINTITPIEALTILASIKKEFSLKTPKTEGTPETDKTDKSLKHSVRESINGEDIENKKGVPKSKVSDETEEEAKRHLIISPRQKPSSQR
ncbi:MAG: DNA mismatch repair protein MutS, partial [Thermoplasmata archaeon]